MNKIRTSLILLLMPFLKWMGKVKSPWSEKTAIKDFYLILNKLKPLDIILSNTKGHLSNVFNPSKWKHAIVYIGLEDGIPMVVEAIGKGVIKRTLVQCIAEKDQIAVLRNKQTLNSKRIDNGLSWLNSQVGKPYDYFFDMESAHKFANFYCSELAYYCHLAAYGKMDFSLRESMGVDTVTPTDFYEARSKYDLIFESKNV